MKVLFALLALASVSLVCGTYNPNAFTMQTLTDGVPSLGFVYESDTNYYYSTPYQLWIPSNTSYFNVTVYNLNDTACSYVAFYSRTNGAACSDDAYSTSNFYCANSFYEYTDASSDEETIEFYPGYSNSLLEWKTGDYFYVSISQDIGGEDTCSYSIVAQINDDCPANTMAITTGLASSVTTTVCSPFTTVANTGNTTVAITGAANSVTLYSMNVAPRTGMIQVVAILNDDDAEFYGNQYSAIGYSGSSYCSESSPSTLDGGLYMYVMDCYVPRTGLFVVSVEDANAFTGNVTFSVVSCPAGKGGYNCTFPEMALNYSAFPMTFNVSDFDDGLLSYNQIIYYVDIPANYTGNDAIMFATSPQNSYLAVRIDGYPEYSSYGYESSYEGQSIGTTTPTVWGLTNFDYVHAGRYYFTFMCRDSESCQITVALNNSVTPTSSGGSSGMSTTGMMMSTTSIASTTAMMSTTSRVSTTSIVSTTNSVIAATTAAENSGFEYLIPSVALFLVALLF